MSTSILKNEGDSHNIIGVKSTVKEVQTEDALKSFMEFILAVNSISKDEVIIMLS